MNMFQLHSLLGSQRTSGKSQAATVATAPEEKKTYMAIPRNTKIMYSNFEIFPSSS